MKKFLNTILPSLFVVMTVGFTYADDYQLPESPIKDKIIFLQFGGIALYSSPQAPLGLRVEDRQDLRMDVFKNVPDNKVFVLAASGLGIKTVFVFKKSGETISGWNVIIEGLFDETIVERKYVDTARNEKIKMVWSEALFTIFASAEPGMVDPNLSESQIDELVKPYIDYLSGL